MYTALAFMIHIYSYGYTVIIIIIIIMTIVSAMQQIRADPLRCLRVAYKEKQFLQNKKGKSEILENLLWSSISFLIIQR